MFFCPIQRLALHEHNGAVIRHCHKSGEIISDWPEYRFTAACAAFFTEHLDTMLNTIDHPGHIHHLC